MFSMILGSLIIVIITAIWVLRRQSNPDIREHGTYTSMTLSTLPPPSATYIMAVFNMNIISKPSRVPKKAVIWPFDVICTDASIPAEKMARFRSICGYEAGGDTPLTLHFANSLPMMASVLAHKKFIIKPVASMIHTSQTINQLRAIKDNEKVSKRLILHSLEHTERGVILRARSEVYVGTELIADGETELLCNAKRGIKKAEEKRSDTVTNPDQTTAFRTQENTGRLFAGASGDYNPWHMYAFTAKLFGFNRGAIVQGYWSLSKSLSLVNQGPAYPVRLTASWHRPIFMPGKVSLFQKQIKDGVSLELYSEDLKHHHLAATLVSDPTMKLTKLVL